MSITAAQLFMVKSQLSLGESFDTYTLGVYYNEAYDRYVGNQDAIDNYFRILILETLMADAAKLVDYRQNQSEEKQGQIMQKIESLLAYYKSKLTDALRTQYGSVKIGRIKPYSDREEERPDE